MTFIFNQMDSYFWDGGVLIWPIYCGLVNQEKKKTKKASSQYQVQLLNILYTHTSSKPNQNVSYTSRKL